MRIDQLPVRITLYAPKGRMGKAIAAAAEGEEGYSIDEKQGDVLVDFSSPDGLRGSLDQAVSAGIPILVGTTGLTDGHLELITEAAESIPVLVAPNTSLGVALLSELVELAAQALGPDDWDVENVEAHHKMKADAPSGTALLLGEAAAKGRAVALADTKVSGRDGITGARDRGSIGFAALRGGTVAGDHSVMFLGDAERLTLSHLAENRSIFARGALKAALWLKGQRAGRYSMNDVLNLV